MKWEVGRGGVPDPEENKKKKQEGYVSTSLKTSCLLRPFYLNSLSRLKGPVAGAP